MVDTKSPVTKRIEVHPKSKNKEVFIIRYDVYGYYLEDGHGLNNFYPNKEKDRVDFVFEDNLLIHVKIISNDTSALSTALIEDY